MFAFAEKDAFSLFSWHWSSPRTWSWPRLPSQECRYSPAAIHAATMYCTKQQMWLNQVQEKVIASHAFVKLQYILRGNVGSLQALLLQTQPITLQWSLICSIIFLVRILIFYTQYTFSDCVLSNSLPVFFFLLSPPFCAILHPIPPPRLTAEDPVWGQVCGCGGGGSGEPAVESDAGCSEGNPHAPRGPAGRGHEGQSSLHTGL